MTTISATTSGWQTSAVQQQQRPPRAGGKDPLDAVTELLGMTKDEITTALKSGQSLDDIATGKGVSHDDLVSALVAGAPADAPQGVDATAVAEKIAAQQGLPTPPPPPGGHHGRRDDSGVLSGTLTDKQQEGLDALASLLGTDADGLLAKLRSGTDLLGLLADGGVSASTGSTGVEEGFLLDTSA
ncbi:hypothetical protein [Kineococcus glutinatus]|uniref:DUF937 domain-containing protein n=1 Tax=Kineococcus glutinatus TaxID=1070872 RepID=A0ABP9H7Z2_9ACTN